jgi:hypothetical protein
LNANFGAREKRNAKFRFRRIFELEYMGCKRTQMTGFFSGMPLSEKKRDDDCHYQKKRYLCGN